VFDDDGMAGLFIIPEGADHPAIIAERLLSLPEHSHLREGEATIEWLLRVDPKVQAGRRVLGTCYLPTVQGQLKDFFMWMLEREFGHIPHFLIILDREYWAESSPREREILVYHELCHAVQAVDKFDAPRFDKDGQPMWALRGHDVEEFTATVERYGAWNAEIQHFVTAANTGGHA
jgi:Putative phage metallopeptidase